MDKDQRKEWTLLSLQTMALLFIFLMAVAEMHPSVPLGIFLSCSVIFLICYRAWAIDRFSPSSACIYSRIFATEYLEELIRSADRCPTCRKALGPVAVHVDTLRRADRAARADAAAILRGAGYPARTPLPIVSLVTSVLSLAAGSFLGAWLPTTSLSAAFAPLYNAGTVAQVLLAPFRIIASAPVLLVLSTTVVVKVLVAQHNRMQVKRAAEIIGRSAHQELEGILTGNFQERRKALVDDVALLAQAAGARPDQARAILAMYGSETTDAAERRFSWRTIRLSTVNELAKNQLMFILGIYLGLALPVLLHFTAPACA